MVRFGLCDGAWCDVEQGAELPALVKLLGSAPSLQKLCGT